MLCFYYAKSSTILSESIKTSKPSKWALAIHLTSSNVPTSFLWLLQWEHGDPVKKNARQMHQRNHFSQARCYTKMVPYWYILNNDARIVIYGTVCFILTKTATFMISLQFLSTVLNRLHDKQNQNRSCWAEYIVL